MKYSNQKPELEDLRMSSISLLQKNQIPSTKSKITPHKLNDKKINLT